MVEQEDRELLRLAQRAYDRTEFYHVLYRERPTNLNEVQFIHYADYYRVAGSLACVDPSVEICGTLPPFHRAFRRMPFTVLESDADIDRRQERLSAALSDAQITGPARVLIVTHEANGPFACDLSTGLGWDDLPASIYYHTGSEQDLMSQVEAHQPDYILWCLGEDALVRLDFGETSVVLIHPVDEVCRGWGGPLLLFCDELNLIGSRPAGRKSIRVCRDQFIIERGPTGRPSLTTRKNEVFPLVRYELANDFEVMQ